MEMTLRPIGATGLQVTPICVGTSPLSNMPGLYGYEVAAEAATATITKALDGPINFLDTSNNYGAGRAETLIGEVLRRRGGVPSGFVLATKVDADAATGEFDGERVRRSVEESLSRLGVDHVELMYLHDPEAHLTFDQAMADDGPVAALAELRDQGILGHVGVAMGELDMLGQFVRTGVFEVALNHNRYTLLDRGAESLIEEACERGIAFVNAAPYGGGILAKGPEAQPKYAYRQASDAVLQAVRGMQEVCSRHDVPLQAAALQFSLRDPRIASTVVGVSDPSRIDETLAFASADIPEDVWSELASLAPTANLWGAVV
ncbi:aldo/keto reductase [Kribbella sp. NBC_00482]|uniref:aldo/keto reductase n=1 Tax=Kribbella sp. NBC_00482 TaxID=2975968 RepID=UPI002E17B002